MEQLVKLTVRLPVRLHERLKQRAEWQDASLNKVIVDALSKGLAEQAPEEESERKRALRVLRESGLWEPMGPEWQAEMAEAPEISHAELREQLKGVPPLSETIIEEREPR
ncbi:MAG: toxin-antitoxin system HicB family antitoxin [Chloroflexota bacterium]